MNGKSSGDVFGFVCSRRALLWGTPLAFGGILLSGVCRAESLDAIPLTPGAKVLRKGYVSVPARSSNGPGLAGMDIYSPARAWLDVDFSVTEKADLTLMILTQRQKDQLSRGVRLSEDPLARVDIEGPETANHSIIVRQDNYFVGFLNDSWRPVGAIVRMSIRAF